MLWTRLDVTGAIPKPRDYPALTCLNNWVCFPRHPWLVFNAFFSYLNLATPLTLDMATPLSVPPHVWGIQWEWRRGSVLCRPSFAGCNSKYKHHHTHHTSHTTLLHAPHIQHYFMPPTYNITSCPPHTTLLHAPHIQHYFMPPTCNITSCPPHTTLLHAPHMQHYFMPPTYNITSCPPHTTLLHAPHIQHYFMPPTCNITSCPPHTTLLHAPHIQHYFMPPTCNITFISSTPTYTHTHMMACVTCRMHGTETLRCSLASPGATPPARYGHTAAIVHRKVMVGGGASYQDNMIQLTLMTNLNPHNTKALCLVSLTSARLSLWQPGSLGVPRPLLGYHLITIYNTGDQYWL